MWDFWFRMAKMLLREKGLPIKGTLTVYPKWRDGRLIKLSNADICRI
jgi:hypothetical protein